MILKIIVCIIAGLGAGIGTGLAGLSAAAIISPMLITFLKMDAYQAVGIALASDVLASLISAYIYGKNKHLDIKNGLLMLVVVLIFTFIGSYIASLVPNKALGGFSVIMTFLLGLKFIFKPVIKNENSKEEKTEKNKKQMIIKSIVFGVLIGFICGFVGAGGGMMMLLVLTSFLGYDLKTAVGTSVFIMSFTALTGAASHFLIGDFPDILCLIVCIVTTTIGAIVCAKFANKASQHKLNLTTGIILSVLGLVMIIVNFI